jgi:DNA-directed RNA polymerase specialized sigma24 family protein
MLAVLREIPREQRLINRPPLEKILAKEPVSHAIAIAYREYGYKLKEIADCLGVHYSTVSRRLRREEELP